MHLLSWFSRSIRAMHVHQQRGFNISTCDASNKFIWTGCKRNIKAATKFCEYRNSAADTQQCLSASFVSRKQSKGPSWKPAAYIFGTYSNIAKDCWDGCTSVRNVSLLTLGPKQWLAHQCWKPPPIWCVVSCCSCGPHCLRHSGQWVIQIFELKHFSSLCVCVCTRDTLK